MTSRLDKLISFVEKLDEKSNKLITSIEESNFLIDNIVAHTRDISSADVKIESISESIFNHYQYLNQFQNLYEKCFYLESNLHLEGNLTNEISFDNLSKEYEFLMCNYANHETIIDPEGLNEYLNSSENMSVSTTTPVLKNQVSISNLQLKPIRCKPKKIYKKKSRYRLSSIYNINPIAYEGSMLSVTDDEPMYSPVNAARIQRMVPSNSEKTNTSSNIMDTNGHQDELNTISTSPEVQSSVRYRSNSLPEMNKTIHRNILGDKGAMKSSNILKEFGHIDNELEDLRLTRLNHFISYNNFTKVDSYNRSSESPSSPIDINDHSEFDNLSIFSDVSYYSPEKQETTALDSFDNFERFLRQSRVDLNNAFPNLIRTSTSHDSIFQSQSQPQLHKEQASTGFLPSSFKFHNPIHNVQLNSSKIATPTIEPIYFNNDSLNNRESINEKSKKLLNEVILKNDKKVIAESEIESPLSKSKKSNFSLFNFSLTSPKKMSSSAEDSTVRRNNIDLISKSLTDSFMSLVNTPTKKNDSTPAKIRSLKSRPKQYPISIENDSQIKRLPIRISRSDGSHSNLIIGPNKTKIINHGQSSVLRQPLVSKISHNSLREALIQSFLD